MSFNFLRTAPVDLLRYLPRWLARDPAMKSTLEVCGNQHEKQRLLLADIARQFFVTTATWGLTDWERMLNIPTVRSNGYDTRRKRILLKLQDSQTSSLPFMTDMINRYTTDGAGHIIEYSKDYAWELVASADAVIDWHAMIEAVNVYKPAHLAMLVTVMLYLPVGIKHCTAIMQYTEDRHCIWNQGVAQTTRWDGTYCLDGTIRLDGIYGANYREHQHHIVEIWYSVEAVQRNLVPVNIWDGSFCLDGSHTLCGMSLQRPPISKAIIDLFSTATMGVNHKRICQAWPHVEAYSPNFAAHGSSNVQRVASPQTINPRQRSAATGHTEASQRLLWTYAAAWLAQAESAQAVQLGQGMQGTQQAAARQAANHKHTDTQTGESAAHHTQMIRQPTAQIGDATMREKINIRCSGKVTNQGAAQHITDYRICNLWDGSFCLDGSHALDGMTYSTAHIGHLCTVAAITKNGCERIERV